MESKKNKISVKDIEEKSDQNGPQNELEIIKSNANSIKAVSMIRSYRQRGHLIATRSFGNDEIRVFR